MLNLCKRSFWSSSLCLLDNCGFSYLKILDVPIRVSRSLEIYRSNVSFYYMQAYSEKNGILGSRVPPFFGKTWKRSKSGKILQRLNLLKNFKRLKIFCKIPWKYTLKIQRNTGGTNMQNPEKYSKFGSIFRKSWKIQVRPKRSSFHFGRNIRKNAQNASFIEIDRDILKNYKTRKNTSKHQNTPENTDNAPQKTGYRRTTHFFQLCMQGRQ